MFGFSVQRVVRSLFTLIFYNGGGVVDGVTTVRTTVTAGEPVVTGSAMRKRGQSFVVRAAVPEHLLLLTLLLTAVKEPRNFTALTGETPKTAIVKSTIGKHKF